MNCVASKRHTSAGGASQSEKNFCNSIIKYQGVVVHDLQELGICPKTQCHLFVQFTGICSPSKSLQLSRQPKRNDLGRNGLAAQTSPACSQSTIASCRCEPWLRCCQFVGLFEITKGLKGPSEKRLQNLMIFSSQRPRAKMARLCQVDKSTALRLHYPLLAIIGKDRLHKQTSTPMIYRVK